MAEDHNLSRKNYHYLFFSSVFHKNRPRLWKRPIKHLTNAERDNHLFRIPMDRFNFMSLEESDVIFPEPPVGDQDSREMIAGKESDTLIGIRNDQSVTSMVHHMASQKQVETVVN